MSKEHTSTQIISDAFFILLISVAHFVCKTHSSNLTAAFCSVTQFDCVHLCSVMTTTTQPSYQTQSFHVLHLHIHANFIIIFKHVPFSIFPLLSSVIADISSIYIAARWQCYSLLVSQTCWTRHDSAAVGDAPIQAATLHSAQCCCLQFYLPISFSV